ncbi:hypothetical protein [Saliphagus infecundisoli]|uniref:DoxX family protein n=1 Tax=Saliphagus infecundisoli TaxID=1849069 RepID=A0ABD5QKC4_9EURY|nr:hypothetical protein [Saliphagus infecundisoli]
MTTANWVFAALLVLQGHFAASYLVPLDGEAQEEFGGLLAWLWPWSDGDGGLMGQLAVGGDLPLAGLFLAMTSATLFVCGALAAVEIGVPFGWWRFLAGGGAVLSLTLMAGFFGATKLLPMILAVAVLWAVATNWLQPPG